MSRFKFKYVKNISLILGLVVITLTGCKYSEEELKKRDEYIEEAENRIDDYLELKYGDIDYKIKDVTALKVASGGPVPDFTPPFSGVVHIDTTKGDVYINTKLSSLYDSCSDNFEEQEIKENLLSELDYHLPFSIVNIELEYGTDNCTNKKLCNGVFDIIDDAWICIETIDSNISDININALRDKFGYNVVFDIINYRNQDTYNYKGNKIDIGNRKNILLYESTYRISNDKQEYKQYRLDKQYDFYTVTDDNSKITLSEIENELEIRNMLDAEVSELINDRKIRTNVYKINAYIDNMAAIYIKSEDFKAENGLIYLFEVNDNQIDLILTTTDFKICDGQYIGTSLTPYTFDSESYIAFVEIIE